MALVALLSARDGARDHADGDRSGSLIEFGGQPLVGYQARLAVAAGAERVLIHVDEVTPELSRLVDQIGGPRAPEVALFQDMTILARSLAPEDRVLLIAENIILPPDTLASLLVAGPAAVLALPAVPATSDLERIDGGAVWGGALGLPATRVLATIDMLGEWDLALTLLRRAVQDGIARVALSPEMVMEGRLALVHDQESADLALQALSDRSQADLSGRASGLGSLLAPVSRAMVRELVRRQIDPSLPVALSLLLASAGLALGLSGWMISALGVMLLALGTCDLARQAALVTLRVAGPPWRERLVHGAGLALLALSGLHLSGGQPLMLAGAGLPVFLIGVLALADERAPPAGLWTRWARLTVPAATLIIFLGYLLGRPDGAFALLAALCALIVTIRLFPGVQKVA